MNDKYSQQTLWNLFGPDLNVLRKNVKSVFLYITSGSGWDEIIKKYSTRRVLFIFTSLENLSERKNDDRIWRDVILRFFVFRLDRSSLLCGL